MQKKWRRCLAVIAALTLCITGSMYPVKAETKKETTDPWDAVAATDWMANGIRFLDIRVEMESDGSLKIVHGSTGCQTSDGSTLYLEEILTACYTFLDEHPTETIVMSMKKDNGDATDAQIQEAVQSYIKKNPQYWSLQNGKSVLNDVRGTIVLARRYSDANSYGDTKNGLNFIWSDQGGSDVVDTPYVKSQVTGLTGLWVQDRYEYTAANKWTAVKAGLDTPPDASNRANSYFLNFMSSAGDKKLNLTLIQQLSGILYW